MDVKTFRKQDLLEACIWRRITKTSYIKKSNTKVFDEECESKKIIKTLERVE